MVNQTANKISLDIPDETLEAPELCLNKDVSPSADEGVLELAAAIEPAIGLRIRQIGNTSDFFENYVGDSATNGVAVTGEPSGGRRTISVLYQGIMTARTLKQDNFDSLAGDNAVLPIDEMRRNGRLAPGNRMTWRKAAAEETLPLYWTDFDKAFAEVRFA